MHQKTRNLPLGRTLPTYAGHDRDASANEDAFHLPGQGAVELVDFRRRARPPTVVVMSVCSRTEAGAQIRMSDGTSNFPASAREGDGTLHCLLSLRDGRRMSIEAGQRGRVDAIFTYHKVYFVRPLSV